MTDQSLPIVRLMPKANARALRHGYPWVYSNEIVADRRSRKLPNGTIAQLQDADRQPMGVVAVTPASKIFARILDRDPVAVINADWIRAKVAMALRHRETVYREPFYRLIHAEADGLPGVVVDRFGDALVVQPNAAWSDRMMGEIAEVLLGETGATTLIKNGTGRTRALEGLDEELTVLQGGVDGPVPVPMNGATYMADLLGGQKTGLFFDQRPNHAFAAGLANGARVLDVFSHVGGFALASLAGGATSAVSVDASAAALALAEQGAKAAGFQDRFSTRQGDAFETLAALKDEGATFDVVICDPPAFAPSKAALEPGLRAYERIARLAAPLVAPGGYLALCSCSHAADLAKFRGACVRGIGRSGRTAQLIHTGYAGADHPIQPQLAESGYLKALFFRLVA